MIVFKSTAGDVLTFRGRFEAPGGIIGDYLEQFGPGSVAFGRTFAEWGKIPDGPVEVVPATAARIKAYLKVK